MYLWSAPSFPVRTAPPGDILSQRSDRVSTTLPCSNMPSTQIYSGAAGREQLNTLRFLAQGHRSTLEQQVVMPLHSNIQAFKILTLVNIDNTFRWRNPASYTSTSTFDHLPLLLSFDINVILPPLLTYDYRGSVKWVREDFLVLQIQHHLIE